MRYLPLVPAFVLAACGAGDRTPPRPLEVNVAGDTLTLSMSPREVATGTAMSQEARLAWEVAADGDNFVTLVSAAILEDGTIVGLDRQDRSVVIFDQNGAVSRRLGGEGDGPGELRRPLAVSAAGDRIAVWDLRPTRPFTLYSVAGDVLAVSGTEFVSDLLALQLRRPHVFFEHPMQWNWEDPSLRMALAENGLYFLSYPDEIVAWRDHAGELDPTEAGGELLRIRADLLTADTVDQVTSGPIGEAQVAAGSWMTGHRPPFTPRTVLAAGEGWWATASGTNGQIDVRPVASSESRVIRWTDTDLTYSRDLQDELIDWYLKVGIGVFERGGLGRLKAASARLMSRAQKWYRTEFFRFGPQIPSVEAMYGSGQCLWIAGFDTETNPYGTALTLIGVNLSRPGDATVLRIPGEAERLRAIGHGVAVTTRYDDVGNTILRAYAYRADGC